MIRQRYAMALVVVVEAENATEAFESVHSDGGSIPDFNGSLGIVFSTGPHLLPPDEYDDSAFDVPVVMLENQPLRRETDY